MSTSSDQESSLLHRSFKERPYLVEKVQGNYLYLKDGTTILDGCGGAAVSNLGHGRREVIKAIAEQAASVAYVHTLTYTTAAAEELAHTLLQWHPGAFSKAYFVGSGSEATDAAMKLARQYFVERNQPQRTTFITRRQAYHGNTWGSMSLSDHKLRLAPYADMLLPNVAKVSPCYSYQYRRAGESDSAYVARLEEELESTFQSLGPSTVVAFVAETVGGATSGCLVPVPGYFEAMQKICRRHGALLILDEVMCGSGRTGTYFAWEAEGIIPDIMTMGKGLGAGYAPIAAVLASAEVIDAIRSGTSSFNHGQTYQAHPVSCATALAVQKILRRERLVERCATMGMFLASCLRERLQDEPHVGDIRGRGLFWAVEFVQDRRHKTPFRSSLKVGLRIQQRAFQLGVALYPGAGTVDGIHGDHVLIAPAFDVTEQEILLLTRLLHQAYLDVMQQVEEETSPRSLL